ncbi:rab11b [Cystoisospora suis]|uniref:Rab11b n=1 Tax=Cystoisospora suis TaxID=483139 RepID=A0A2C6KL85_9APIC|nr:rab11b [Cystoisospora suis]
MMVGNKIDLVEKDPTAREVPYDLAAKFAQSNGLYFSEASAVSSFNVKHIFEHLLQEIYNQRTQGNRHLSDGRGGSLNNGSLSYRSSSGVGGGVQLAASSSGIHGRNVPRNSCCA